MNSYYPLPQDYPHLTKDGQKQARMSVLQDRSSAAATVTAWWAFRQWYLKPVPNFYKRWFDSPPFHYQIIRDAQEHDYNVLCAPRGSAKSVVAGTELPLLDLCTMPYSDTALCLSTDAMVEERFDRIMEQLDGNDRILDDFGKLKIASGVWNRHYLRLANGAKLRGFSTEGRKRGARPDRFILDDPEYDPKTKSASEKMREDFEWMLFRIIMPMLEEGCKLLWIGTILSRKSFLYWASSGTDKRFKFWNIRIYEAGTEMPSGEFTDLLWPKRWTSEVLIKRKQRLGAAAFYAECMNKPMSEQDRLLDLKEDRNLYHASGPVSANPLAPGDADVTYNLCLPDGAMEPQLHPYAKWVRSLFRMTTVDFAYTVSRTSDFSCVVTTGFDRHDIAHVLDLWLGKASPDDVRKIILAQGARWQSHVLAPESIAIQKRLAEELRRAVEEAAANLDWHPAVISPKYPVNTSKGVRIANALEWRVAAGKLKLPASPETMGELYPLETQVAFRMLRAHLADFTVDLQLLMNDDDVDALAMIGYVPRRSGVNVAEEREEPSFEENILQGKMYEPITGLPYLNSLGSQRITPALLDAVRQSAPRATRRTHRRARTSNDARRQTIRRAV